MDAFITILIVDDEQKIREGIRRLINWENAGFKIVGEASNGQQAVHLIQRLQPDIVITDLMMPEMDGIELTTIIQKQYPSIRFIVLSSYDDFSLVSQSFKNGAVDYLLKPTLNSENLLKIVEKTAHTIEKDEASISKRERLIQKLNHYLYNSTEQYFSEEETLGNYFQLLYTDTQLYDNKQQLLSFLNNTDLFFEDEKTYLPFYGNNNECGLVFFSKNKTTISKEDFLSSLQTLNLVNNQAFFLLSDVHPIDHLKEKNNYFSNQFGSQSFYFKQEFIVKESELFILNKGNSFDTKKFIRDLLNNDFSLSLLRIEKFLDQMILSFVDPIVLKQQASSFFYTLISSLEEAYPQNELYHKLRTTFFADINNSNYLEDFSQTILQTTQKIRKELIKNDASIQTNEDELVNEITRFIQENFHKNLSLKLLSDTFHFSYNYLSSFFSKRFKSTFTDYLNTIRLKESKKLLIHSTLNVSEISETVGYSDVSYFSKIFKKEFGITPSRYRKEKRL